MGLSVTLCNKVNAFFDYLLGPKDDYPRHHTVTAEDAKEAAKYIVEQTSKSLGAGWNARDIDRLWNRLELPALPRQVRYRTSPDNPLGISGTEVWTDGQRSLVEFHNGGGLRLYATNELVEDTDDGE